MKDLKPMHSTKPSKVRSSRKANKASDVTIERIVDSARRVLIEYGYAGFTTRRVASAAAISVGNLAYHFPSKRELLRAVVAKLVAEYSSQFQAILADPGIPTTHDLESLMHWLLTDAVAEETMRTFRELWAISLHDEVIREAMDNLYDDLMSGVVQLLRRYYPNSDVQSIRELAQLLALISEGSVVLYGTRRDRIVPHERIIELAVRLIQTMALDLKMQTTDPDGFA